MAILRARPLPTALAAGALLLCGTSAAMAIGEPVNREAPKVTSSDLTLSTTDGVWVGETEPFAYGWLRCASSSLDSCAHISGESAQRYVITRADIGSRIRSEVTATNPAGSSAAPSAPTAVVDESLFSSPEPPREQLRPKPVVTIDGLRRRKVTFVRLLTVTGPVGAIVTLRCRGRGCPIQRLRTSIGDRNRLRLRRAERTYRAGNVLVLQVVDANAERLGKYTRVRFRDRSRIPLRTDACLQPGESAPSPCP